MTPKDIDRVETALRSMLGNSSLRIVVSKAHGTPEVWNGPEFIGTLHRDDEDGEVSYSVTIVVLDEDLPQSPKLR